jgi:hypothetical protein
VISRISGFPGDFGFSNHRIPCRNPVKNLKIQNYRDRNWNFHSREPVRISCVIFSGPYINVSGQCRNVTITESTHILGNRMKKFRKTANGGRPQVLRLDREKCPNDGELRPLRFTKQKTSANWAQECIRSMDCIAPLRAVFLSDPNSSVATHVARRICLL